ncbi:MAG: flagellar basal body rod protein FlgF [Novosphingobium sp.]|jgi:flagellar basal-body rod protein FlgF
MDRMIWTAVTGMNAAMTRQRVIASNMANAQTTGFRAEVLQMTPMTLKGPAIEARAMTDAAVKGALMTAGVMVNTGRPLDVAMQGQAMLTVQAPDGSEAYTRRGDLSVSTNGLLVNGEGFTVMGAGGPISVPPGGSYSIAEDGAVLRRDPGAPDAAPAEVARIKLASPAGTAIAKGLDGLFRVIGGGVLPGDAEARLAPATLEQSNVKPSEVLVDMVEAQRLYDMRAKLVATAKDLDEGGARLMRVD